MRMKWDNTCAWGTGSQRAQNGGQQPFPYTRNNNGQIQQALNVTVLKRELKFPLVFFPAINQ